MLGSRSQFRAQRPVRHPLGYGGPLSNREYRWKALWPSLISTIFGVLIILCGLLVFVLEIAALGVYGNKKDNIYSIGFIYALLSDILGSIHKTGVGIWSGVFIMAAGVLILIIRWMKSIRLWAFIAFLGAIVAACFAIINFSINAARVDSARGLGIFDADDSGVKSLGGLPAAQIAFGVLAFLLCLAYIGLFLYMYFKIKGRRSDRQQAVFSA